MPINSTRIPYPDFKMYEIIDPEQHDANNAELVGSINNIVDLLNRISGGEIVDNIHANAVEMTPVVPFNYRNVSDMLTALIITLSGDGTQTAPRPDYGYDSDGNLVPISYDENGNVEPIGYDASGNPIYPTDSEGNPITSGTNYAPSIPGAELIKIATIAGLTATHVQGALEALQGSISGASTKADQSLSDLGLHKSSGDHDTRYYRKQELDTRIGTVETTLTSKTDKTGDHQGTWNGKSIDQVTTYSAGNPAFVEVLEEDPAYPFIGQMWMVVKEDV